MASTDTLILLSKAFDSFFKRARNRARIMANNRRMARRNEKTMGPAAKEMLDYITAEVQKGLPKLKSGKASAIKRMVDWKHIEEQAALIIKPAMLAVLVEGGKSIVERKIVKQERFDPIGVAAVDWSSKHSAALVTEITKKQRTAIGSFVTKGLNAGKSIPTIMRELRPTVGILERYMGTIANARAKMIAEGVPAAKIASRTDRMARHYHHLRINTIARTETARAQNEGILQGYGQMGIGKVDRIEDPATDAYCVGVMRGGPYTLERARTFSFHPNEEGTWVAAVGEKLEPYEVIATGPRQAKITSLDDALKELPRRHVMSVKKYYIDTTAQLTKAEPRFAGRDIAGFWDYANKEVHLNAKWFDKQVIFHETGHAVYSTGIVPFPQKPLWKAWYQKATAGQIKYPSQYALTNESEFFAECYSHYHLKDYHLIDNTIKKWFDKNIVF